MTSSNGSERVSVQPVEKDDVAEVLRRLLFDAKSVELRGSWPQQVFAALKGIAALDDQTAKNGAAAEERYLKSYPFHPELTEVFYTKWSAGIERFQKTRGVLRTFALALREAEKWDESPLVGPRCSWAPRRKACPKRPASWCPSPTPSSPTARQRGGRASSRTNLARPPGAVGVGGLKLREIEQAAMATFRTPSRPAAAKTRDLRLLAGPCRPDRIELEKGLGRWGELATG